MPGRFAQSKADGSYRPGSAGGQFIPAEMVAQMSSFGGGQVGNQTPALLYGADGQLLTIDDFRSPLDGSPGVPLQPRFTDPDFTPREFQFTPGFNLIPTPRAESNQTRFAELRMLVAACPYLRIAISDRKQRIRAMKWEVGPLDDKTPAGRKKFQAEIDEVTNFLRKPNRIDNLRFGEFISQATEEVYVTDALTFFKHPTKDGSKLHSLVQINGETIKPVIDQFGHVVGYQQILYGYPTTQYRTQPVPPPEVVRTAEELEGRILYLVSTPKVDSVYGSPVAEEIRPVVDLAIRRWSKQLAWYTDGTVPEAVMEASAGWTPDQIVKMQAFFDQLFTDRDRAKVRMIPAGSNFQQLKPFQYTKEEEEALLSLICARMGVPRSLFVAQTNRATAQTQRDDSQDVGVEPLKVFHTDWLDDLIQSDFGFKDLGFEWVTSRAGDEYQEAQARALYVSSGIRTIDEVRADMGDEPLPESERPEAKAAKMAEIMAASAKPKPGEEKPGEKPVFGQKPKEKPPAADEQTEKAELAAWEKFARRRVEKGKQSAEFVVNALPKEVADLIVRGLAAAGTDSEVRDVFTKAKEHVAARRKSYEVALKRTIADALSRQHAGVLDTAKKLLPEKAEAAA
jgi:hypothetical protein